MKRVLTVTFSGLMLCACATPQPGPGHPDSLATAAELDNYTPVYKNYDSRCQMARPLPGSRLGPTCNAAWPNGFDIGTAGEMDPAMKAPAQH